MNNIETILFELQEEASSLNREINRIRKRRFGDVISSNLLAKYKELKADLSLVELEITDVKCILHNKKRKE